MAKEIAEVLELRIVKYKDYPALSMMALYNKKEVDGSK